MYKVNIKNIDGEITNIGKFEITSECEDWILENSDSFPAEYTYEIIDISEIKEFEESKTKGLKNQEIGKNVLAIIYAINEEKAKLGLLNEETLTAIFSDNNLRTVERLLLNGSLGTAKQMIINSPDTFFSAENKQVILDYINANS